MPRAVDPKQMMIAWEQHNQPDVAVPDATTAVTTESPASSPLIQRLPWDFETSFPEPTEQAIEAGVLQEEDFSPECIKSLHTEHAHEASATLQALDVVMDARRRNVDPRTGKPPRTEASRKKLSAFFESEPKNLLSGFQALMDVYEDAFGSAAREAFEKAIRARHAHIPIVADPA